MLGERNSQMKNLALKLMGLLSVALAVAFLVPQRAAADEDDPPGRIARLSYTHGAVSFEPAGTDDWVSAVVNRPMTTGDKLWSDNGARAELHIGSAAIRLGDNTGFSFLNLTDNTVQLQLTAGTLNIRVRRLEEDETFEVDTPNLAFSVLRPGRYRINVNESGDATVVVVRDGQGEATGGGSAYAIHPHEIGTFSGTDQLDSDIQNYGRDEEDDFDQWCNDRDRHFDRSVSSRYVSDDVVGYEDLDDYGGWRPVPEYGNVWFPHVTVVGWAPYRYGHWVWISPWGWNWVEDEPWGFAPFHYGRWVAVGGVWGWVPCPPRPVVVSAVYVRPVYSPALVAWVGGAHWGVGIGIGGGVGAGVAWFPLGPREVYVPSYHVSQTYVTNVNISNTTVNKTYVTNVYNTTVVNNNNNVNVTNIKYVNQTVPGAVTATSHAAFTSAQPVARNMVKVDQKEIASAPVSTAATNLAPQKQAVLGAGATATVKPPARFESRAVVARTAPPPPPPSFEKQESAIKANGGKPLAISQTRQLQTETARAAEPVKIAPPAKTATPQSTGANRTTQQQNAQQQNVQQQNNNRPPSPSNPPQNTPPPANQNKPGYTPANANSKNYNDRPPSSRPVNPSVRNTNNNSQLEQKHQQEVENLHRKQDQERQRVEQQQYQQQQRAQQQQADEKRREQLNQQHQQQLEQIERKHDQEQRQLQQRQQQERQKAQQKQQESKPPKEEKEKPKPR
jgi:hypothetical protein